MVEKNQLYDVFQAALIPAFIVGLLSIPGIMFGGFELAGHTFALDSTVTFAGVTAAYGTILAMVAYAVIGTANDAWSSLTDAKTDDAERLAVGGELAFLALVVLVDEFGSFVASNLWGGLGFVLLGAVAVYYVAFTR